MKYQSSEYTIKYQTVHKELYILAFIIYFYNDMCIYIKSYSA